MRPADDFSEMEGQRWEGIPIKHLGVVIGEGDVQIVNGHPVVMNPRGGPLITALQLGQQDLLRVSIEPQPRVVLGMKADETAVDEFHRIFGPADDAPPFAPFPPPEEGFPVDEDGWELRLGRWLEDHPPTPLRVLVAVTGLGLFSVGVALIVEALV